MNSFDLDVIDVQDARRPMALGVALLVAISVLFIIFFFYAPLEKTISGAGAVVVASEKQVIQSSVPGVVDEIRVKDGDTVEEGQPLIYLDSRSQRIELDVAQVEFAMLTDALNRINGRSDVIDSKSQRMYARSLANSRSSEVEAMRARLQSIKLSVAGSLNQLNAKTKQLAIMRQQRESVLHLVENGFYAKTRMLDLDRALADLEGEISRLEAEADTSRANAESLETQIKQRLADSARDDGHERLEVESRLNVLHGKINALRVAIEKSIIRSPVSGEAVGLSIHTIGGSIAAGQKLLEIVPVQERLLINAQFPASVADRLKQGQSAQIHFLSMDYAKLPDIFGTVKTVSADALIDERSGTPFIKAVVELAPSAVLSLSGPSGSPLRPGFPVEVVVSTGERTISEYLLGPLATRIHVAMTQ